jgi:hypothetical protein
MSFITPGAGRRVRRIGAAAAIAATVGLYAAATAHAAPSGRTQPLPVTPGTRITNSVTSTTTGSNCITGTEPGCSTVLTVQAVPVIDPGAAVVPAVLATATAGVFLLRRRRASTAA